MSVHAQLFTPQSIPLHPAVTILLVEDLGSDARLIEEYLLDSELKRHKLLRAETLGRAREMLYEEEVDLILVDLFLPDSTGLSTFEILFHEFSDHPIVVLTGLTDEDLGLKAVQRGAQDFLNKNELDSQLLSRSIKYALERHRMLRRLEQAQTLARMGHWEADLDQDSFHCSAQIYAIFEKGPAFSFNTFADYVNLISENDQEQVAGAFLDAVNYERDFQVDHCIPCAGGREKFVSLQGKFIPRAHGQKGLIVGTAQDITDRRQVEILTREKDVAERAVKVRQEFLAKTSHEIRNPLNPILVLTDLLLATDLTAQQREYLAAIKNAGANLLAVVNDILDLSRIEAGKIEFNHRPFLLKEVFDHLQDMLSAQAREKGLSLDFHIKPGVPATLIGDPIRLTQILMNLLSNAIKFTSRGIVQAFVRPVASSEGLCTLEFSVIDTGVGIPQDKLSQIFDSFSQLKANPETPNDGAGLGLSIAHQLVTLQGGAIWVESQINRGSTFFATLDFDVPAESQEVIPALPVLPKYNLNGARILLVEDNPLNQLVTTKVLTDWSAEVDVADNGKACIPMLYHKAYDLILMDLHMPEMDGFEATRYIREQMPAPVAQLPIIALTADAFEGHDDICIQFGMNDFISKPFEVGALYAKIAKQLRLEASPIPVSVGVRPEFPETRPSSPVIMTPATYTNLDYLREVTSNDTPTIRKTIQRFLDLMPEMVDEMKKLHTEKDFYHLGRTAHKMKTPIAFMGIEAIRNDILKVEAICKSNEDLDTLPPIIARVEKYVELAYPELKQTLSEL